MSATYIIAEAGVNHNGALDKALALVDVAHEAGADAVKFQHFKADNLVSKRAPKAAYQQRLTREDESQWTMLKRLELTKAEFKQLAAYCRECNLDFLCTPFDGLSLQELTSEVAMRYLKIPSGEITNAPFLLTLARAETPIILSTGMSTLADVENALSVLAFGFLDGRQNSIDLMSDGALALKREAFQMAYASDEGREKLKEKVTLLHCTTEYPAPIEEVNLRVLQTLKHSFGLRTGYSDHTKGITIPIAAVAMGAEIIEKHITLSRELPGPDHQASLEPNELKAMVRGIREVEQAMGDGVKRLMSSEVKNKPIARKSLVANAVIKAGERFSSENLCIKRPGQGVDPMCYWDYLGKTAKRDYQADDLIE
jgi:N-acetylneuraminate synthase